MNKINRFSNFSTLNESTLNEDRMKNIIKIALENMYMFGGMPRPDPKYDSYLESTINYVMKGIKNEYKSNFTEEQIEEAASIDYKAQTTYDNSYDRKKGFKSGVKWVLSFLKT